MVPASYITYIMLKWNLIGCLVSSEDPARCIANLKKL